MWLPLVVALIAAQPRAIEIEFPNEVELPFARTSPLKPLILRAKWVDAVGPELDVWVSFGKMSTWQRDKDGSFVGEWQPPDPAHPGELQIVVSTILDGRVIYSAQTSAVSAEIELPGKSEPDAEVEIFLGGDTFGPVRAAHDGRFKLLVTVPPNTQSATAKSKDRLGNLFRKTIDLFVPVVPRLALVCPVRRAVAGGASIDVQIGNAKEAAGAVKPLRFKPPERIEKTREVLALQSGKLGAASCIVEIDAQKAEKALVFWEPPFIVSDGGDKTVLGVRVVDRFGNSTPDARVVAHEQNGADVELLWQNDRFEATIVSRKDVEERRFDIDVWAVARVCRTSVVGAGAVSATAEKDYRGVACKQQPAPSFSQKAVLQQIPDRGVRLTAAREGKQIVVRVLPDAEATPEKVQASDERGDVMLKKRADGALIVEQSEGEVLVTHVSSGTSLLVRAP